MNPVLAEVYRNDVVESFHRGSAVVMDSTGKCVMEIGDGSRNIYPRSALKLLQAIPLVETGAADHFGFSDREIAVACASHSAEEIHTSTVSALLNRIGLSVDDLENGPDMPLSELARNRLLERAEKPAPLYQNCSGKHAGMLALASFLDHPTRGYSEYDHPVQQLWMQTLSELTDIDVGDLVWELDGCGMPAICMPMASLALGCALFADCGRTGGSRAGAMQRILSAVRSQPEYVAGSDRCCTHVIRHSAGKVVVKTGAEGVYSGLLPERSLGFVLKIDDGSSRGSEVALGGLLKALDAISPDAEAKLEPFFRPAVTNSQGRTTGRIVPGAAWDEAMN